jgi:hypothetical protein
MIIKKTVLGDSKSHFQDTAARYGYSIRLWSDSETPIEMGSFGYLVEPQKKSNIVRVEYKSELEYIFEGTTKESATVEYDRTTLRPIHLICRLESMSKIIQADAIYKKNKIEMSYWEDGLKDVWKEKIPFNVLDNYQTFAVLRTLDYKNRGKKTFCLVNALTCSVVDVECAVTGKETISSPLGNKECYRLCLQIYDPLPYTQYCHIQIDPPHAVVKAIKGQTVYQLENMQI